MKGNRNVLLVVELAMCPKIDCPVAQVAVQEIVNLWVTGSIPVGTV